jgi:periplasmic protein TonB
VGIRADGSLESIAVDHASGQKVLDQAATRIVEMASPYAPFPPEIKRDTDILYITRTWTFAPGDSLTSE